MTASEIILNLDDLIKAAPDETPMSPEQMTAREQAALDKKQIRLHAKALGPATGWGARILEAVKTPAIGPEWHAAFDQAKDCLDVRGILCLYGNRGAGKTRMAAELALHVGSSRYRTAQRLFLEIRDSYRKNSARSEMDIVDELVAADLLVLDEIQERGETAFEDRKLTHIIDARYMHNKPTILISNLDKQGLAESLGNSAVDRIRENGKAIEFSWPSYRGAKS